MRRPAVAAAALLTLAGPVAAWAAAASAAFPPLRAQLDYRVYFAGARVAGMDVDIGLGPRAYDMKMHLETAGLVGTLFPWWMEAYSRGRVEGAGVVPGAAGQRNEWRGEHRWVDLRYREGEVTVVSAQPAADEDGRDGVGEAMRRDTLDLASAVLRVMLSMGKGGRCAGTIPVFDGRRRYDMVLRHRSTERLSASAYSPYAGRAERCAVTMKRIGGSFESEEEVRDPHENREAIYEPPEDTRGRGWREKDRHAEIWIGEVFDGAPQMPVRLDFQTPYGTIRAHLHTAEVATGGETRRLAVSD